MQAVQHICQQKVIGDIVRIEAHMCGYQQPADWWRSSRTISGGILYDWGVHLLEYSLQLINSDISEVSVYSRHGFWASKTVPGKKTQSKTKVLLLFALIMASG